MRIFRKASGEKSISYQEALEEALLWAIAWRLHTAKKDETRKRRMTVAIEMLKKGEKYGK